MIGNRVLSLLVIVAAIKALPFVRRIQNTNEESCYVLKNFSIIITEYKRGEDRQLYPYNVTVDRSLKACCDGYIGKRCTDCIDPSICGGSTTTESVTEPPTVSKPCYVQKNFSIFYTKYKRRENGELIPYNVTEFRSTKDCCDGYGGERCRECLDPEICGENRPVTTEEPEVTEKSNVTEGPPPTCSKLINFNITYTDYKRGGNGRLIPFNATSMRSVETCCVGYSGRLCELDLCANHTCYEDPGSECVVVRRCGRRFPVFVNSQQTISEICKQPKEAEDNLCPDNNTCDTVCPVYQHIKATCFASKCDCSHGPVWVFADGTEHQCPTSEDYR